MGITLRFDEPEEFIPVMADKSRIKQVMVNLLDNALKYSAPGSMVSVDLVRTGRNCVLSVRSPGEPISEEDLQNIFKRFYRADKARERNGSYGLGLSIAESIVQAHKGRIWAESREDCNIFYVQLPVSN